MDIESRHSPDRPSHSRIAIAWRLANFIVTSHSGALCMGDGDVDGPPWRSGREQTGIGTCIDAQSIAVLSAIWRHPLHIRVSRIGHSLELITALCFVGRQCRNISRKISVGTRRMGAMSARWASISRESAKCCSTRSSYRALMRIISACNCWSLETGLERNAVILSASSLVAA